MSYVFLSARPVPRVATTAIAAYGEQLCVFVRKPSGRRHAADVYLGATRDALLRIRLPPRCILDEIVPNPSAARMASQRNQRDQELHRQIHRLVMPFT